MYIKNWIILIILLFCSVNASIADEVIKAQNNAFFHNNKGLNYLKENYYFGAIKEFQMAIDLSPNTQASSTFYTNLGLTYEKIGYPILAQPLFEKAVKLNPLYFENYVKMTSNYKKLGILEAKLEEYQTKLDNPLNNIVVGLIYIQKGDIATGITILDDFCDKEKNLIITPGVKAYIDRVVKEKL